MRWFKRLGGLWGFSHKSLQKTHSETADLTQVIVLVTRLLTENERDEKMARPLIFDAASIIVPHESTNKPCCFYLIAMSVWILQTLFCSKLLFNRRQELVETFMCAKRHIFQLLLHFFIETQIKDR